MMKRMLLVFNPKSGHREFVRNLYKVINLFVRAGYEVTVYPTAAAGDGQRYIAERGADFDLVVCSGGDGMMSEAVNACMPMEAPPTLGYIPAGTTNDFAVSLDIPRDIMAAARLILNGNPRLIDIGLFGDRFFSYVAAFGMFTDVSYSTDQNTKNILGRAAYFLEGIKQIANMSSVRCVIDIDGESIEGDFTLGIITNSVSIGGFQIKSDKGTAMDDGFFEAFFVRRPKNLAENSDIIGALTGMSPDSDMVIRRTARRISFTSAEPCGWTVDGEFGGRHTKVIVENMRQALAIIAPPV